MGNPCSRGIRCLPIPTPYTLPLQLPSSKRIFQTSPGRKGLCCFLKFIFGFKGRVAALSHALSHDELHAHGGHHPAVKKNFGLDFPSFSRLPSPTISSVGHNDD